jgi:hypothetical protein
MAKKKGDDLTPNKQVELVTMYGTDKSPFHAKGESTQVHPDMVEHFKKRGLTTEKPSEDDEVNEEGGEEI